MDNKKSWLQARALSDKGPTFAKVVKTSPFHMMTHDGPVPVTEALEGVYAQIGISSDKGAQHNPTVWVDKEGALRIVVRSLHGRATTNFVGKVQPDGSVTDTKELASREPTGSLEDLRVFLWRGAPWAIAAHHNGAAPPVAIRQALLELSDDASEVLRVHVQSAVRHEKNWMPCVDGDALKVVYSTDPLVVLNVDAGRVTPNAALIPQTTSFIRGGTQLVRWDGGYIALVHQVHRPPLVDPGHSGLLSSFWAPAIKDPVSGSAPVVYLHRFAKFDAALSSVEFSKPFYFRRLGVEFAAGLTLWNGGLMASFGVADCEAWLVEVISETVTKMFS